MGVKMCVVMGCDKPAKKKNKVCSMHSARMCRNGSYELPPKRNMSRPIDFKISDNGCFEVTSHIPTSKGYFNIRIYGKRKRMHRHIYEECFGEIPEGLVVRHKCDNRKCINPEHLELGTHLDNVQDAIDRRRFLYGEKQKTAKLTTENVKTIKKMLNDGAKTTDLAKIYGVDRTTISLIKRGKNWSWVEVG